MTGRQSYLGGLAAEDIAARLYTEEGATILAHRWRSAAGEIDLIVVRGDLLIFVEVKARRTLSAAAHALSPRQQARLQAAIESFLAETGRSLATEVRFDVVLVDRQGQVERIENALA
ncbi:MAG: YraN family protein [Pseudomonadota bacterium]